MKKIITLLAVGTASLCFAQHNIYELIDYGLKNSTAMKAENIFNKNIEIDLINSYLSLLPTNSLSFTKSKSLDYKAASNEFNLGLNPQEIDPIESSTVNANFSLGKSFSLNEPSIFQIKNAKISNKNSKISIRETRKNIAMSIFNKYILVLQAEANLVIARDNLIIQQGIFDMSEIKHQIGNLSDYDLQMSEVNLISQQIQVKELENNIKELRKSLFSYINMKDDQQELKELDIDYTLPELLDYENNNIKIAENDIKKQKNSLFQQKLGLFPMPTFGANYSSQNVLTSNNLVYSLDYSNFDVFDSDDFPKSLSFNFGISYNIFDIPKLLNNYSISKRNFTITELNLQDLKRTNKDNVEMAILQMESLKSTLELYEKKLTLSRSNFEMSKKQYELGMINITDFEKARVALFSAEIIKNNKQYLLLQKREALNLLISNKILGRY